VPHKSIIPIALITALVLCACGPVTTAGGPQISIEDAWARPVPAAGGNGAIFFRLVNAGNESDQLVGGQSPVAGTVEVHKTTMEEGVMKMEHIAALEVPAKSEVLLKPGDYHVMLIDVSTTLAPGDTLPITLNFEKSGEMALDVEVRDVK
jgi:copper(I)-binding protein